MDANKSFDPSEKEVMHTRRVNEWSVGHRVVGPIVVFCVMCLGAASWLEPNMEADAALSMSETMPAGAAEYFPARYMNQATSIEAHIPAF
jgi:hypothetical protein